MSERNPAASVDTSLPLALIQMMTGFWVSRAIYVAAKLGIADLLKDGSKGIEELSKTTGSHGPPLYGVLRALASIGIFAEDEQGRFVLTPLADALRSDVPGSLHAWVNMLSGEKIIVRGVISCTVQTGESAFDHEVEG